MADEQVVDPANDSAPVGTETDPVGDAGAGVAEEKPFFVWKDKSGKETVFKNAGEVATHLTHSSMRREEVDTELGKVGKRGKYLDGEIARYKKSQEELDGSEGMKYHKMLSGLQQTNPQGYARLKAEVEAGQGTSDMTQFEALIDRKLKPVTDKQEGLDKAEEGRRSTARRDAAAARYLERDPTFDRAAAEGELKRIQDIPPDDLEYALYDLLWSSVRGRENPAELERRAAAAAARPRTPSVKSTPGVKPTGRDPNDMTAAERREAGKKLIGG